MGGREGILVLLRTNWVPTYAPSFISHFRVSEKGQYRKLCSREDLLSETHCIETISDTSASLSSLPLCS